ncbi:gamma-glutamylcyclotransferase [Pseudonocardia sp. ICBG1142]|uniref:gamma-glutamylcyclotransferase family protein n=1 Tax=Pseudonocardia sp. ICBG1142 TaxID=2846760 RepID=UPI001CF61EFD|nr:gamma-glutamylcyclotransferase family protein [Pseudonocardia sp. ICBG1142]
MTGTDTTAPWPDSAFPADPYPGARPPCSFLHVDGRTHPLTTDPSTPSGWRVDGRCLDDVLAGANAPPMAGRVPLLAYGSNACPSKISWMREAHGLTGPAVVLRVRTEGLAAVWSAGRRVVDDQRPATLAAVGGAVEEHTVWLVAPEQFAALDAVEGRDADPPRYRLARVATGRVTLVDAAGVLDRPWAYLAPEVPTGDARTDRRPLHVDGAPVRCADLAQAGAVALSGAPGPDGLDATTVDGVPVPEQWPSRVFVYGTLMPGRRAFGMLRGHASDVLPQPVVLPTGAVADTGRGYPALTLDTGDGVPGWVVELADPETALAALDAYEGPEYARSRVVLDDGTVCWAWVWTAARDGHVPLPHGWSLP